MMISKYLPLIFAFGCLAISAWAIGNFFYASEFGADLFPLQAVDDVHNFGEIRQEREYDAEFQLCNTRSKTINIESIRTDCGCAVADSDTRQLEPDATTIVKVKFKSGPNRGDFEKQVVVGYRVGDENRLCGARLKLIGHIQPEFSVSPINVSLDASKQNVATVTFVLESDTGLDLKIRGTSSTAVSAEVLTESDSPKRFIVNVAFEPSLWNEIDRRGIIRVSTGNSIQPEYSIPYLIQ